jgi:hypothetical protein
MAMNRKLVHALGVAAGGVAVAIFSVSGTASAATQPRILTPIGLPSTNTFSPSPLDTPPATCPTNYMCGYSSSDLSGANIWQISAAALNGQYLVATGHQTVGSVFNRTLGQFCTYNGTGKIKTNTFNAETGGTVANPYASFAGGC